MSVTLAEHNFVLWSALTCKDLTSISRILCNKSYFHCVITIALLLSLAEKSIFRSVLSINDRQCASTDVCFHIANKVVQFHFSQATPLFTK